MQTTRARDVDDVPGLSILDPEVRCCGSNDLERRGTVQVDNGVPLLVRHLVNDTIPCVSRVVDNDVNLAASEICGFLDEFSDVVVFQNVAYDGDGGATALFDFIDNSLCLVYTL